MNFSIYGSDISRRNIDMASKNAEKACVGDIVQLEIADFRFAESKPEASFLLFILHLEKEFYLVIRLFILWSENTWNIISKVQKPGLFLRTFV